MNFTEMLQSYTGKPLADCTNQELYLALLEIVRHKSADKVQPVTGRKLYYISAEFLIGKLLSNNLINLGLYDDARAALAAAGKSLSEIEEVEPEPSLGNGGLGRLAACFLDSLATLGLPGDGVGLRYHFGLFRQSFENGLQNEKPDPWLTAHSWAEKTDITYPVQLAGKEYTARLYKLAVTGYGARTNTLNLFDLDSIDESIVHDGIAFDKTDIDKNLTLFLYPDDSDEAGRRLRVYQQYLMVSAGAQLILAECAARGCDYHDLADYAAIQINDTHPSMVIPELIRLLGEKGIEFEEAVEIVTKTCAYTNHTILAEALEKWPRAYLDAVVPQLMPIIEKLDELARTRTEDESLAIIDKDDRVHMAHMDIHSAAFSVKGIAPDLVQQLISGKDNPRIVHQQTQKLKFLQGQIDRFTGCVHDMAHRIDLQVSQCQHLFLRFLFFCPAQHRFDPRHQRHHSKWLCHIIICAAVQSDHLIVLGSLRGKHNHREFFCLIGGANFLQNCQTVLFWQHNIQQHQVRQFLLHCLPEC